MKLKSDATLTYLISEKEEGCCTLNELASEMSRGGNLGAT